MRVMRHQVKKGGALSIYQLRGWQAVHGLAYADLEVREHDELVVVYGYERGPHWGVRVESRAQGEALIEWLVRVNLCLKPEVLADWREDSPFKGLAVVERSQFGDAPPGVRAMMSSFPARTIDL